MRGGGQSVKWQARAEQLRFGSFAIDKPLVALSTDEIGTFAHADFDLNLGGNILKRFNLTIDYPQRRLIFEPNTHAREDFRSDASGLVLKAEGPDYKNFVVRAVVPNSPAAEAGVQAGDIINSINGAATERYALWELQEEFKKSGATCELGIRRGQTSMVRKIRLRSLL